MLKAKQNPDWRYLNRLAEDILATLGQIIEMQKKMSEIFDRMLDDQPVPDPTDPSTSARRSG